ncbi:hypothetical protein [Tellurirhabdus bombi]|uniref:hypothetical protein n=1 Tax=Tellurirhabdus bombi TaxID=2907205 RepID=UPI001F1DBFA7|nr:hypothetical protein [Tellurirhabdus bombi]
MQRSINPKSLAESDLDKSAGRSPQPASLLTGLAALLLVVPIAVYGWFLFRYAVNIPKWDDHVLKFFLLNFREANTWTERFYQLFKQHNEHRIVYDRLVSGIDYLIFGKLNYIHLMVIGNLSLIGLLALFAKALRRAQVPLWMALPVALLLFNLAQWENMYWGMAALQNFTVILLIFATLYVLSFRPQLGWLAFALAIAATLTSGNGLVVWPIGLALLLLRQNFGGTMRWLLAMVLAIRIYFINYQTPPGNPPVKVSFLALFKGWLAFNGAGAEAFATIHPFASYYPIGVLITLVTLALCLYRLWTYLKGQTLSAWDLFYLGGAAFLLGTGVIVTHSRAGFGLETLLTSRYKIYSLLLFGLTICYGITLIRARQRTFLALGATFFSFVLAALSYTYYLGDTIMLRKILVTYQFNWTYTQNKPESTIDAVTQSLLDNQPAFYDRCLPTLFGAVSHTPVTHLDTVYQTGAAYTFRSTSFPVLGLQDEGAYLVARSAKRVYLFPTRQTQTNSRRALLESERVLGPGFTAQIEEAELENGVYTVQLLQVNKGSDCQLFSTGQQMNIARQAAPVFQKNW